MPVKVASIGSIELAAAAIRSGSLVAFPTETVYGLGANALSAEAVRKIFELKGRPASNPLIVHIANPDQFEQVAVLSPMQKQQLKQLAPFWPGPLTVVLPRADQIAREVNISNNSVALRIPDHAVARDLIIKAGVPIAAPSANRSASVSPTLASHVRDEFGEQLLILDGGACRVGIESTVLSLLHSTPTILRPGSIGVQELEKALEQPVDFSHVDTKLSPGSLALHYAPKTKLKIRGEGELPIIEPAGLIAFRAPSKSESAAFKEIRVLSTSDDLNAAAHALYATLRELDQLNLAVILVDDCQQNASQLALAIMDRLKRAQH